MSLTLQSHSVLHGTRNAFVINTGSILAFLICLKYRSVFIEKGSGSYIVVTLTEEQF